MIDRRTPDDLEVLAAGFALGLLDDREHVEALRYQLKDRDFAQRVREWQQNADLWLESVDPVDAPANALATIEEVLDQKVDNGSGRPMTSPRRSAKIWRNWAISATAASLVLAAGLGWAMMATDQSIDQSRNQVPEIAQASANVAQIKDADGTPLLSALYDPQAGTLSLRLADLQQPDLGPELWIIPQDGVPRSLGLIDSERLTVTLSPELRSFLQDGATMAITIEPRKGAPHNAPTGDILGTATLQEVPGNTI
ncbi:anti-sigma factor [Qipengyuania flava]|nr:anti-sigma factor [Qipengyuania flava]